MLASPNQDFGNHETIHKRASGKFRPATNLPDSGRMVGNAKTTGNLQTFMAAYAEGRSNSKLNDRTNKFGSLRPPQPHASASAGADGACLAGRKKNHPFVERAYVLLKFAGRRGVAPAIFLVVQVGHLTTPLRKLSDCGTAS